jgi:hypothetical protein
LAADPNISPQTLARQAVEAYGQTYPNHDETLAAIRADSLAPVIAALDAFADAVIATATDTDWLILQNAKSTAQSFGSYRDIGRFMDLLVNTPALPSSILGAASTVLYVLPIAIEANFHGQGCHTTGLTVYMPAGVSLSGSFDDELDFVGDTDWEDLLLALPGDSHEPDDSWAQSLSHGYLPPGAPFAGTYYNDDWFAVLVPPGSESVSIDLAFLHGEGDLDLELYSPDSELLASAVSTSNDESIAMTVPTPDPENTRHYIRVFSKTGLATGQSYTLTWNRSAPAPVAAEVALAALLPLKTLDVEFVVRSALSRTDALPVLPTSQERVFLGDEFFLETWIRNKNAGLNGIAGGYIDLTFDNAILTAQSVGNGGLYANFPEAAGSPLSANVLLGGMADLGVLDLGNDEWVRLGYIEFATDRLGTTSFTASSGSDRFARVNQGAIDWKDVEHDIPLVAVDVVEPPAVTIDLQAASDSGVSDEDNITKDSTPTYNVTVNYAGSIALDYDGDARAEETRFVFFPGTYSFTPDSPLADGGFVDYPVEVTFVASGIGVAYDRNPTTIDTRAPLVRVDALTTVDTSPMLTGTVNDPSASVVLRVGGPTYFAAVNSGSGEWTLPDDTISPNLNYGVYDVVVFATDPAGNRGGDPTVDELVVQSCLADAGGPYLGNEGSDITLDGSRSQYDRYPIVSYRWDLDNDGQYDDATGITATFNSANDGVFIVGLRVTDDGGASDTDTATITVIRSPAQVVGRHIFYNNSKWDGHAGFTKGDPAANAFDDGAIATDKQALLPGQTGTFANYTSYPRGINGIMVDIQGLADPAAVADGDLSEFDFRYGNDDAPGDWLPVPAPLEVTVRDIGGVDRITFIWADNAIPNKNWVQVTVKEHPNTGLAADDFFYFGNTIGENTGDFRVDYSDAFDIIWPLLGTPLPIGPDHVADINRDGRIDYSDVFDDLWPNLSGPAPLKPISPPVPPPASLESTDSVFREDLSRAVELIWFDRTYDSSGDSEEDDPLESTAVDSVFSVYYEE